MIRLTQGIGEKVRTEAEAAYPNECCGFLLGQAEKTQRVAQTVLPIQNAREEGEQYHRFVIEAEDFLRAEREAAKRGQDIVAIYHSHPDHPSRPSEYDRDHALPFYSYIIVSVSGEGKPGTGTTSATESWELSPQTRTFTEEPFTEERPSP